MACPHRSHKIGAVLKLRHMQGSPGDPVLRTLELSLLKVQVGSPVGELDIPQAVLLLLLRASLSLTISRSFPKFTSIESAIPSFSRKSFLCPPSELGALHLCCDPNHVYLGTSFSSTTTTANNSHVLVWAAVTNDRRLDGLSNKHLFLSVLEAGSLRSGCRHGQGSWRGLFLLCLHEMEGEIGSALFSSQENGRSYFLPIINKYGCHFLLQYY